MPAPTAPRPSTGRPELCEEAGLARRARRDRIGVALGELRGTSGLPGDPEVREQLELPRACEWPSRVDLRRLPDRVHAEGTPRGPPPPPPRARRTRPARPEAAQADQEPLGPAA